MALELQGGAVEDSVRQRVGPTGHLSAAQVPGGFDVVEIEYCAAAYRSDLLPIGSAPEMLNYRQIVRRTVFQKRGDFGAEAGEAVD